jgi:hypothetical protein
MKIRFTKDVSVDVFNPNSGDHGDRSFRRWQEVTASDLIEIDNYHFEIELPNGDILCEVKKEAFEVLG